MTHYELTKTDYDQLQEIANFIENEIILYNYVEEGRIILDTLAAFLHSHQELEIRNPDLYVRLQYIVVKLKFLSVVLIKKDEFLDLLEHHFAKSFEMPFTYDMWGKTRARLGSLILFADRDKLKADMRQALLLNQEELTEDGVVFGTEEKTGVVGNWLLDYHDKVGTDLVDTIKLSEYLNNSQNTAGLSKDERHRVASLVSYYEKLKRSSFSTEGMEETFVIDDDEGHTWVMKEGQLENITNDKEYREIEDIAKELWIVSSKEHSREGEMPRKGDIAFQTPLPKKAEPESQAIIDAFNLLPISISIIHDRVTDITARLVSNPRLLDEILKNSEKIANKADVVAALLLAAKRGDLTRAKKDAKEIHAFIRNVLEGKLGWSSDDSSKIGIRIDNILGEPYRGMAYYNTKSKRFEWAL